MKEPLEKLWSVLTTQSKPSRFQCMIRKLPYKWNTTCTQTCYLLSLVFLWLFSRDGIRVALKIIKNQERYREAALIEVEVLKQMNVLDSENRL